MIDGQKPKKRISDAGNAPDEKCIAGAFSIGNSPLFPSQELKKTVRNHENCFSEKAPLTHICTNNTDLKNGLSAPYSEERRKTASEAMKKHNVYKWRFIKKFQIFN